MFFCPHDQYMRTPELMYMLRGSPNHVGLYALKAVPTEPVI